VLDRHAYREAARDPLMTGPAVLLFVLASLVTSFVISQSPSVVTWLARVGAPLVATWLVFAAGRILGRKGTFTTTLRAIGFAQAVYFLGLLAFIPALAPVVRLVVSVVSFIGVWLGAAEAHDLRGWRSLVFPVVFLVVIVVVPVAVAALLAGAQLTLSALAQELGLAR
jgi:hypothetical protein